MNFRDEIVGRNEMLVTPRGLKVKLEKLHVKSSTLT